MLEITLWNLLGTRPQPQPGVQAQIEHTEEVSDKMDNLFELFFGKEDNRQGITSDPVVSVLERLGTASYYVGTRQNGLTNTEHTLIKNAKSALQNALQKVNAFFENDWSAYQSAVESIDLSPFKATEMINLDN